jgi:LysM repeat protein
MKRKGFLIVLLIVTLVFLIGIVPISAAPDASGIIHVVQRGETLYSIARRYGVNMWAIAYANGIVNPNRIYVGQRLVIPTSQPSGGTVHVVQRGETLTRIALRYGVSIWTIANANGIVNINHIYVGQRLTIPGTAPKPQPQPQPVTFPGPWSGEYFDNVSLYGSAYTTREDGTINFNWSWGPPAGGMPVNYFSVRWTGTFSFAEGKYRFYAKVDDGVRVYVDDELIIDGWRDGGYRQYAADRTLAAGDRPCGWGGARWLLRSLDEEAASEDGPLSFLCHERRRRAHLGGWDAGLGRVARQQRDGLLW